MQPFAITISHYQRMLWHTSSYYNQYCKFVACNWRFSCALEAGRALKKPDADHEDYVRFHPTSNKPMVSKVVEKAAGQ